MIKNIYKKYKAWMAYNPPSSLTGAGWDAFNDEYELTAPIRYFFWNTVPDIFWHPIRPKLVNIKWLILYRTSKRYNKVITGLPPGYYNKSTIILNVNFNILKDFVEVELARMIMWSDEYRNRSFACKYMPFYNVFIKLRSSELGIKHLDWASTLDDPKLPLYEQSPAQAAAAREIKALYIWWTVTRPARTRSIDDYETELDEDTEMLVRLMKVRNELSI